MEIIIIIIIIIDHSFSVRLTIDGHIKLWKFIALDCDHCPWYKRVAQEHVLVGGMKLHGLGFLLVKDAFNIPILVNGKFLQDTPLNLSLRAN